MTELEYGRKSFGQLPKKCCRTQFRRCKARLGQGHQELLTVVTKSGARTCLQKGTNVRLKSLIATSPAGRYSSESRSTSLKYSVLGSKASSAKAQRRSCVRVFRHQGWTQIEKHPTVSRACRCTCCVHHRAKGLSHTIAGREIARVVEEKVL